MHILFCNFHSEYGAGHDTYLLSLIKTLKADHKVALASPASSQLYIKLKQDIPCFAINYKTKLWKWRSIIKQLHCFKQWLETQDFDIIHVNGSADHRALLLIIPLLKKRPKLILTKHNSLPIQWGAKIRMRYFSDAIIAVCQYTQQQLLHAGIRPSAITVIENGIDTQFYAPLSLEKKQSLRQAVGFNADDFILVSNAGTLPYKNWPAMLAAVAALPNELKNKIKVIIAGIPPTAALRNEIINKFKLSSQVIFPGLVADVRPIIALGDVGFVLSNAVETISFACREMQSMGLPVIVTNYAGLPENISPNKDGWIVPVNDIPALTQCLTTILSKKDLITMSHHAREKALKNFPQSLFINKTLSLYQNLINAAPPAHH
jgi:L-malate glycosyltransferase